MFSKGIDYGTMHYKYEWFLVLELYISDVKKANTKKNSFMVRIQKLLQLFLLYYIHLTTKCIKRRVDRFI